MGRTAEETEKPRTTKTAARCAHAGAHARARPGSPVPAPRQATPPRDPLLPRLDRLKEGSALVLRRPLQAADGAVVRSRPLDRPQPTLVRPRPSGDAVLASALGRVIATAGGAAPHAHPQRAQAWLRLP